MTDNRTSRINMEIKKIQKVWDVEFKFKIVSPYDPVKNTI
jgi:hypothetical protein